MRPPTIDADHREDLKDRVPEILMGVLHRVVLPGDYAIVKKVLSGGHRQGYDFDLAREAWLYLEYVKGQPEEGGVSDFQ